MIEFLYWLQKDTQKMNNYIIFDKVNGIILKVYDED